jgi:hypothetical protein
MNARSASVAKKEFLVPKIAAKARVNRHLIASESTLRYIFSGHKIKEREIFYKKRSDISRDLLPQKIPNVICHVVKNFASLKRSLLSSSPISAQKPVKL